VFNFEQGSIFLIAL